MEYTVRHITQFRYSAPITESVMEVRMQPRREGAQHCLAFDLVTQPRTRITATRDYLGNIIHHFDIPAPHTQLSIIAQSLVSIATPDPLPVRLGPTAWDELDALVADGDYTDMLMPSDYARPTQLLRELARELRVERRTDPLSLVREVNERIFETFSYTPQSTRADSPIDEALQMRAGVCQDYAHIMISLLRTIDMPARYVSGYLYRPSVTADSERVDATHAWVEALLPDLGWVGFDPTNNQVVADRHIRVAVGRDYRDVPPTRGVFKGAVDTELGVAVRVLPADSRHPASLGDDELLLVMKPLSPPAHSGEQPEQQQQTCAAQHKR